SKQLRNWSKRKMGPGQKEKGSDARGQGPEVCYSYPEPQAPNPELPLSVYMITYNNGGTIETALQSVAGWANEVVVVDSHSTDGAQEIIRQYTERLVQYDTKDLKQKYQYAQDQCRNPWVLFIDADEWLTPLLK